MQRNGPESRGKERRRAEHIEAQRTRQSNESAARAAEELRQTITSATDENNKVRSEKECLRAEALGETSKRDDEMRHVVGRTNAEIENLRG